MNKNGRGCLEKHFNNNELITYTMVGLGSTLIQYLVYSACCFFTASYLFANIMGFLVSVWNSYF